MPNEAERTLRRTARVRVVLRYAGELSLILGMTVLVPTLGAAVFGEYRLMLAYGLVGALLVGLGWLARRAPAPRELQPNEALAVTTLIFLLSSVVMSGPLVVHGLPWIDALFEAISGVTTTGLSTLASIEGRPRTVLLARAWMQWVGGLGFVVLSLAIAAEPGVATRRLGSPSLDPAHVGGSMRAHARRVLRVYLALTGLGVIALMLLGATGFDALVHTLAGVSTGGFAPRDSSLAELGSGLQVGVLGIAFLGAVSLPLYAELRWGRWKRLRDDPEVRTLLLLVVAGGSLLCLLTPEVGAPGAASVSDLALISVSAQTTAGFSTFNVEELSNAGKAVLILSMIAGGSQGSTAGGIKLLRILIVIRLVHWLISRTRLPPHAVSGPTLLGERLEPPELLRAAALILLFLAVLVASWLPFLAYGYSPLEALFEVASATGTVGLSMGISRPDLEPLLKGVLCVDMLLGRLEIFAFLVAFSPRTWIGRRVS